MLNKIYNFSLGIFIGLFFISIFFGYKIEEKIKPKININLGPFVKDSCIIIFNKHIHHWLISLLILFVLYIQKSRNSLYYILNGYFIVLICHGLLYDDRFDFSLPCFDFIPYNTT